MIKKILLGVLGIAVLLVVIGLVLPGQATVTRSVVVNVPPATAYAYLNGYGNFNQWSPWAQLDPNTQYSYSGPASGVGAKMTWKSTDPNVGGGMQEIIAVVPNQEIHARLKFDGFDGESRTSFLLRPESDAQTQITWRMVSDMGASPVNRWFGVFLDKMVGPDYEKGLTQMKPILEALPR